jgi:hypothetical protein
MSYVSKENAVGLNHLGFQSKVLTYYFIRKGDDNLYADDELKNYNLNSLDNPRISAPTLQEAADWLRDNYGVHISFLPESTTVLFLADPEREMKIPTEIEAVYSHDNHRNMAISYCIGKIFKILRSDPHYFPSKKS